MSVRLVRAPKALHSGYAGKRQRDRKQTIRTPAKVIDYVRAAFGGTIALDPCASRAPRHHFALSNHCYRGLSIPWLDRTYVNCPYDNLIRWLQKCQFVGADGRRVIACVPWRSHRHHYCAAAIGAQVLYLKAFPFEGQKNSAPFPCVLLGWGFAEPLPHFAALELGRGTITSAPASTRPLLVRIK